jgi:hypothetical protein
MISASSGCSSIMASGGDAARTHTALGLSWCFSTSMSGIALIIRRDVVTRERAEYVKIVRLLSLVTLINALVFLIFFTL